MTGRPPKPNLSWDEIQACRLLYAQGKGHRLVAAAISEMRGANAVSITAAQRSKRLVSPWWMARQPEVRGILYELREKDHARKPWSEPANPPRGNLSPTGYSVTRIPPAPTLEKTDDHFLQPQKAGEAKASADLEVSSTGGKA